MNTVLIATLASAVFCSLYTLILPTLDAYVQRRDASPQPNQRPRRQPAAFSLTKKTESVA